MAPRVEYTRRLFRLKLGRVGSCRSSSLVRGHTGSPSGRHQPPASQTLADHVLRKGGTSSRGEPIDGGLAMVYGIREKGV